MRVLVTGGTGFIGRRLLEHLADSPTHPLRALVRTMPTNRLSRVEYVMGDVTNPDSLNRALIGVERVYHLAGATRVRRPQMYDHVNAQGTRNLAQACARCENPPTVVYVSSLAAAGPSPKDAPRDESQPPTPVSKYGKSKLAGERYLREISGSVPVTVLRPPSGFGPGDPNTLALFKGVRAGFNLTVGWREERVAWLHVDDFIRALLLADEHGQRMRPDGEEGVGAYFIALDQTPTMRELGNLVGRILGKRVWTIPLPATACWILGYTLSVANGVIGRAPLLSIDKMREALAGSWICQTQKAQRELGFVPQIGLEEGLKQLAEWYHSAGWL